MTMQKIPKEYIKKEIIINWSIDRNKAKKSRKFKITKDTYIPTQETRYLLREVIYEAKSINAKLIVEVGTGCGIGANIISENFPEAKIIACDKSKKALKIAEENKRSEQITNVQSNYVDDLNCEEPEIIFANLPWGSKHTLLKSNKRKDLHQQPINALFSPNGPLGSYEELFLSIKNKGWNKSIILIETGSQSYVSVDRIIPSKYRTICTTHSSKKTTRENKYCTIKAWKKNNEE